MFPRSQSPGRLVLRSGRNSEPPRVTRCCVRGTIAADLDRWSTGKTVDGDRRLPHVSNDAASSVVPNTTAGAKYRAAKRCKVPEPFRRLQVTQEGNRFEM